MSLSIPAHCPVDGGCTAGDALWAITHLARTAEAVGCSHDPWGGKQAARCRAA